MRRFVFPILLSCFLLAPGAAFAANSNVKTKPNKPVAMSGGMNSGGMSSGMNGAMGPGGGASPVPEPSGLLLFASTLALSAAYVRSTRKKS